MNDQLIKTLKKIIKDALKNVATKDDLIKELSKYATKEDLATALANHPTKKDLKRELDDLAGQITVSADKNKAEKSTVIALEKRVDKIEQTLSIVHQ